MVIRNCHFTTSITFHKILHGFWEGCGTATYPLKEKVLQQLMAMREEILYAIVMVLKNSYDALERDRCLDILEE